LEFESARLLADYGIPTAKGMLAINFEEIRKAAEGIGYPVVLKACSPDHPRKQTRCGRCIGGNELIFF